MFALIKLPNQFMHRFFDISSRTSPEELKKKREEPSDHVKLKKDRTLKKDGVSKNAHEGVNSTSTAAAISITDEFNHDDENIENTVSKINNNNTNYNNVIINSNNNDSNNNDNNNNNANGTEENNDNRNKHNSNHAVPNTSNSSLISSSVNSHNSTIEELVEINNINSSSTTNDLSTTNNGNKDDCHSKTLQFAAISPSSNILPSGSPINQEKPLPENKQSNIKEDPKTSNENTHHHEGDDEMEIDNHAPPSFSTPSMGDENQFENQSNIFGGKIEKNLDRPGFGTIISERQQAEIIPEEEEEHLDASKSDASNEANDSPSTISIDRRENAKTSNGDSQEQLGENILARKNINLIGSDSRDLKEELMAINPESKHFERETIGRPLITSVFVNQYN